MKYLVRNVEALRLYRDILRGSKHFVWKNEAGVMWRDLLRVQARREFEEARTEKDPAIIAKLLFVGRDCLNQTLWKFEEAAAKMKDGPDKRR